MWMLRDQSSQKKGDVNGIVAVAIDRNRGSQQALKWTIHHLLQQGQTVHLIHVSTKPQASGDELESQAKELLAPFHCICTSKDIQCKDIILENTDIPKALIGYVSNNAMEHLVMGAPRIGLLR
ncbi:hypothetical protein SAY87_019228 [Trapa incisa]|uniref:RING-type E3 ubiquitin transferase n=1 Tax=Trapa incisa TaxID=236973 RepID=A0AAN7K4J5_9MYRT|nr:hypothetical protein SAY87_019228 [Trapa incisa]